MNEIPLSRRIALNKQIINIDNVRLLPLLGLILVIEGNLCSDQVIFNAFIPAWLIEVTVLALITFDEFWLCQVIYRLYNAFSLFHMRDYTFISVYH